MIPIQNLYYLLLYALDGLDEGETVDVAGEPETDVLDLLGVVLKKGVDHLLRQGLYRTYIDQRETIPGVRGKLDVSATLKADALRRGRTVCEFDEFSHDILHNQILKTTIGNLLRTDSLEARTHELLRGTWHRLHEISDVPLTARMFRRITIHRSNRLYRFLISVCRLLYGHLIPNERTGGFTFRRFVDDERRMRIVFERFVRNFYKRHAAAQFDTVRAERITWKGATASLAALQLLPSMRTDVTLRRRGLVLVVDTKYYQEMLQEHRGRKTVRSAHLYQLFTYLKNVDKEKEGDDVQGLLIYPVTTREMQVDLRIQGHRMQVNTLNLNQHWSEIHSSLLAMLPCRERPVGAATAVPRPQWDRTRAR